MACKTSAGQKGAAVKYAGSDFATDKGVVIYFTKDNIICKNPNYKEAAVYNKGYYFLPIETEAINQTGIDLFDPDTPNQLTKIEDLSTDSHYKNLNGIDKYSSLLDSMVISKICTQHMKKKLTLAKKLYVFLRKTELSRQKIIHLYVQIFLKATTIQVGRIIILIVHHLQCLQRQTKAI